jgi:hypothetical protein
VAQFQKGVSGNPKGKPKGAKDKRTELRALFEPHKEELVKTLIHWANIGDMSAMRIVMDRLMPPVRESPIRVTIPKITGPEDCTKAQAAVLNAVAAGEMLPGEGQVLSGLIDAQRRAYETSTLAKEMQDMRAELDKLKPKESKA